MTGLRYRRGLFGRWLGAQHGQHAAAPGCQWRHGCCAMAAGCPITCMACASWSHLTVVTEDWREARERKLAGILGSTDHSHERCYPRDRPTSQK